VADEFPAVQRFMDWLTREGFTVISDRKSESFGDRSIVLMAGILAIRITRDRGIWMIDIAQPYGEIPSDSADIWFEPKIWQSYLDGTHAWTAPTPLDSQISFVETRLGEIRNTFLQPDDIGRLLRELRKSASKARFSSLRRT